MIMRVVQSNTQHDAFWEDLKKAVGNNQQLPAIEMLAILSKFTGLVSALQDQQKYTPEMIIHLVMVNFEKGNSDAVEQHLASGLD
jgi:hypothetical protein